MKHIERIGKIYNRLLYKHPLLVHSVQTGILMGTGDVIAQKVIENKSKLDYFRTAQFFTMGTVAVGPALSTWYKFLSRHIDSSGKSAAFKKVALDQLIFAPSFLAFFIIGLNILQGRSFSYASNELHDKYIDILVANYKLWPAVQLINFYLTPVAHQVLVVQIVALVWNSYLSWKTQKEN